MDGQLGGWAGERMDKCIARTTLRAIPNRKRNLIPIPDFPSLRMSTINVNPWPLSLLTLEWLIWDEHLGWLSLTPQPPPLEGGRGLCCSFRATLPPPTWGDTPGPAFPGGGGTYVGRGQPQPHLGISWICTSHRTFHLPSFWRN